MRIPVLLLGIAALVAAEGEHDHDEHDHGGDAGSNATITSEWAGIFETPESTYVWTAQQVDGEYVDPMMAIVVLPATAGTDEELHSLESEAEHSFETECIEVDVGETLTAAADVCYNLHFHEKLHTSSYVIDTTDADHIAIFAQHFPTEFERDRHYIQDLHGDDIEPLAELPEEEDDDDKPWGVTIGATLLVSLCTMIGVIFLVPGLSHLADQDPNTVFSLANSFASGALLAAAFYLMLYEATHLIVTNKEAEAAGYWGSMIIAGFITANVIELIVSAGQSAGFLGAKPKVQEATATNKELPPTEEEQPSNHHVRVRSGVLLGDFLHNLVDGLVIAAAFSGCSDSVAWGITGATVAHELAQELSDYLVLTDPKQGALKKPVALLFNFLSGLSVTLGAIIYLAQDEVSNRSQGMLLAYGGGVYLQIGAAECMPRVYRYASTLSLRLGSLALFCFGTFAIGIVLVSHEHCSAGGGHEGHGH